MSLIFFVFLSLIAFLIGMVIRAYNLDRAIDRWIFLLACLATLKRRSGEFKTIEESMVMLEYLPQYSKVLFTFWRGIDEFKPEILKGYDI